MEATVGGLKNQIDRSVAVSASVAPGPVDELPLLPSKEERFPRTAGSRFGPCNRWKGGTLAAQPYRGSCAWAAGVPPFRLLKGGGARL